MTGPRPLRPCGTRAAYKRHRYHGEEPCDACKTAEYRAEVKRKRTRRIPVRVPEVLDPVVPYRYRARRYPWAVRALARSEAEWGRPESEEAA